MTDRWFSTDIPSGNGFAHHELPSSPLQSISIGICMDINPHPPYTYDDFPPVCELAEFAVQKNARILVLLCAWLHSDTSPDSQWDMVNIEYWLERVQPLWERPTISVDHSGSSPQQLSLGPSTTGEGPEVVVEDRETIVVISNRTGIERGE